MPGDYGSGSVGRNTNVTHDGRTYHVQSEDSGPGHPHVITHLFAEGGRILVTRRTPYHELDPTDRAQLVPVLIALQHRIMERGVRGGRLASMAARAPDEEPAQLPPLDLDAVRAAYEKRRVETAPTRPAPTTSPSLSSARTTTPSRRPDGIPTPTGLWPTDSDDLEEIIVTDLLRALERGDG